MFIKVPKHLIPRKWSDKSHTGATRIKVQRASYSKTSFDPFSDWSNAFYRHKVSEARSLRKKRRDKMKWDQRMVALYMENTEVKGISPVTKFLY